MERVDEMIKLEKILSNVENEARKEIEDAEALAKEELETFKKEKEREFEREKERILKEHGSEMERLKKIHSSKKSTILRKYRTLLKSSMRETARRKILELLKEREYAEVFVKRALEKLKIEGNETLECSEEFAKILESHSGEVRIGNVDGVAVLEGNSKVIYSVDEFVEECLDLLRDFIDGKVGELG